MLPHESPIATEPFVLGQYLQALLSAYTLRGGSLQALADRRRCSLSQLCQPPIRLAVEDYLGLLADAAELVSDPCLGLHIGLHMQTAGFDTLGRALLAAETLGVALQQVLALEREVHSLGFSELRREGDFIRLVWHSHYQLHPQAAPLAESVLAGIVQLGQRLAGRPMPVMAACFEHSMPAPERLPEYRRLCRSRCLFSQPENSLLIADEVLAWPVIAGDDSAPVPQDFASRLTHYLQSVLAQGCPRQPQVAAHFHMTTRTLQRRLAREGVNYQGVLDASRSRLAEDYLRYSNLQLLEVSELLGFREQSSFNHFFIERFAVTPSVFRGRYGRGAASVNRD